MYASGALSRLSLSSLHPYITRSSFPAQQNSLSVCPFVPIYVSEARTYAVEVVNELTMCRGPSSRAMASVHRPPAGGMQFRVQLTA